MDFCTKGRFLIKRHIWFVDVEKIADIISCPNKYDEMIIHGNSIPITGKGIECKKQNTLITNLRLSDEELLKKMHKTVRNEINRTKRDCVPVEYYNSDDLKKHTEIIYDFAAMLEKMYSAKGMAGKHVTISEILGYIDSGCLFVGIAWFNENPFIYHVYVKDNNICRLLYSCSDYREEDKENKALIGRVNKFLHWNEMMYFKSDGLTEYDWGGISDFENPNGIDTFKMSFGGERKEYYNIFQHNSLKSRFYHILKD